MWGLDGKRVAKLEPGGGPQAVAPSPEGKTVAVGVRRGGLVLFALPDAKELWRVEIPLDGAVEELAFSPDGTRIAACQANGTVVIRDARTGETQTIVAPSLGRAYRLAFSPDGKNLAAIVPYQGVVVWNLAGRSRNSRSGRS